MVIVTKSTRAVRVPEPAEATLIATPKLDAFMSDAAHVSLHKSAAPP